MSQSRNGLDPASGDEDVEFPDAACEDDATAERRRARQELWVTSSSQAWSSLAVVPAVPGVSAASVARALAQVGGEYLGRAIELCDARGLRFDDTRALVERVGASHERHALLALLDCPLDSQPALLVARAASAALLVVPVGGARLGDARKTVDAVGRARFIGAVTLVPRTP